jgi:signal transduction histidine kinase
LHSSTLGLWTQGGNRVQAESSDLLGTVLTEFVHDVRNPLSSLHGAAYALRDEFDRLPPLTRTSLMNLVVSQVEQIEWLLDALVALGGRLPERLPGEIDLERELALAGRAGRVDGDVAGGAGTAFVADSLRFRLALQCLIGSARGAAVTVRTQGDRMAMTIGYADPEGWADTWHARVAERLLREEGCALTTAPGRSEVLVLIAPPADLEDLEIEEDAG